MRRERKEGEMTKAKISNPMQSKDPQSKAKDSQCKTKTSQCMAKTPSARQNTLSVRQRPQCMAKTPSAKTPSARQKTLSVRQRPQCMTKTPSARPSVHLFFSHCLLKKLHFCIWFQLSWKVPGWPRFAPFHCKF